MTSRLFHSVVYAGISLGTMASACVGRVDSHDDRGHEGNEAGPRDSPIAQTLPDSGWKAPPTEAGNTQRDAGDLDADSDASADAGLDEGGDAYNTDAPSDALLDAFCDAPWPTTKGGPSSWPACIDPQGECSADGGPRPIECIPISAERVCGGSPVLSECRAGRWTCPPGTTATSAVDCLCWGFPPGSGSKCTDAGWQLADAGSPDGGD